MTVTDLRILADDLTGALDSAAGFAGSVPVYLGHPPATGTRPSAVSVLATPTRDIPPETLPIWLAPALEWLAGGRIAFKKIDSLLRGNSYQEVAWLMHHGRFTQGVFAPAFPAQGRITHGGQHWRVQADGNEQPVGSALQMAFAALALDAGTTASVPLRIPEVRDDATLDALVADIDPQQPDARLWCGSAGLAHALARRLGLAPATGWGQALAASHGPTVLVSASFQASLREQWMRLDALRPGRAQARCARPEAIDATLAGLRSGAHEGWFDLSAAERLNPDDATARLQHNTRRLAYELPRPGQLIIIGGDTLLGLCKASGATGLLAQASVQPGWGCARFIGGAWDGVPCYTRSGAFGSPDDLVELFARLAA